MTSLQKWTILAVCLLFSSPGAFAQIPDIEDFTLIGDTYRTDDRCLRLTEERDYASGSIWYKHPVSLKTPFSVRLRVMLGCKDTEGADGMVFVMTPQGNQIGYRGEGIGFAGMVPSVGIEIDTWQNFHLLDPGKDHIAIMANGQVGHFNNLIGPNIIANIEDCKKHSFVVLWRPDEQTLSVEIDGEEVVALKQDLVKNIFGGNDVIYWGMTAATGRYNNIHEVCFDYMAIMESLPVFEQGGKMR